MGNYFKKAGKPALINDFLSLLMQNYGVDDLNLEVFRSDDHNGMLQDVKLEDEQWTKLFFCNPSQKLRFNANPDGSTREFRIQINFKPEHRITEHSCGAINALAVLGHNFYTAGVGIMGKAKFDKIGHDPEEENYNDFIGESVSKQIYNFDQDPKYIANSESTTPHTTGVYLKPRTDGFSIIKCRSNILPKFEQTESLRETYYLKEIEFSILGLGFGFDSGQFSILHDVIISSLVCGHYYEFPVAPDMAVAVEYDFDGVKTNETVGGSEFAYIEHVGKPFQFAQGDLDVGFFSNGVNRPKGRKRHNITFSSVANRDLFPAAMIESRSIENDGVLSGSVSFSSQDDSDYNDSAIGAIASYHTNDLGWDGVYYATQVGTVITMTDSFYKNVILHTLGGALPFIFIENIDAKFQAVTYPDGTTDYTKEQIIWDQFCVCRVDKNSFRFTQSSHNVFSVALNVYETF